MKVIYEVCPVCGKKGWHLWSSMFYQGHECRYCMSSRTEAKWVRRIERWEPIQGSELHRGPKAPKE